MIGVYKTQEKNDLEYLGLDMVNSGPLGVVERLVLVSLY